jgi:predicted Ser/Thr protein kinase
VNSNRKAAYTDTNDALGDGMKGCSNLYALTTLACALAECLSEDELTLLAADLVVLSDQLANIVARSGICTEQEEQTL